MPKLAPTMPEIMQRFVALLVMTVLTFVLVSGLGWWRKAGFNRRAEWRDLHLLWLPAVVLFWPLLYGVRPVSVGEATLLVVGYLLTGLMEEALARGVIFGSLLPKGVMRAVFVSALLLGAALFSRMLFGSPLVLVLVQVMFAVFDGILYAALRVRMNTIWPLVLLHAATTGWLEQDLSPHHAHVRPTSTTPRRLGTRIGAGTQAGRGAALTGKYHETQISNLTGVLHCRRGGTPRLVGGGGGLCNRSNDILFTIVSLVRILLPFLVLT